MLREYGVHFDPLLFVVFPMFVLSVLVHECAHGLVALRKAIPSHGGRQTLNPIPNADPMDSLLLPGLLLVTGTAA
jgi:hypothetical protein